jgi:hypothetical protein
MQTSLVGDLIQALREAAADPCQNLPAPANVVAACSPAASLNYWFKVTQLTPWGESAPSSEVSITNGSLTGTYTITGNCSFAATALKVYLSPIGAGLEDRFFLYTPPSGIGAFSISFTLSSGLVVGYPPQRSSAWLPDTDGTALSAAGIYRWINEGLDAATALTEGIRDITGVPTTASQAQYQLIGNWRKLNNQFFDGYPVAMGNKFDVFRHSNVQGLSGTVVLNQDSQIQLAEFWPQPDRTSGNGTLNGALAANATSIPYTPGSSGWVLGFGLALIGPYPADPSACELVYYSGNVSNSLTMVQRAMGGTMAQAWPNGASVMEVNAYVSGLRTPQHYTVGQSAVTLALPPAWIDAVQDYLTARFKKAEQDIDNHDKLMKSFETKCQGIKGNRQVMGPRRVQAGGTAGVEVVSGAGGYFGGIILP